MPPPLASCYEIRPYVRAYPVTEALEQECIEYLNRAADCFENAGDYYPPLKINKDNEFFCSVLCGHGDKCSYLRDYLDTKTERKEAFDDLFG